MGVYGGTYLLHNHFQACHISKFKQISTQLLIFIT